MIKSDSKIVSSLIKKAQLAQKKFERFSQQEVDETILAIGWALLKPDNNKFLSELAVSTTGLGNVDDKIIKNQRKTLGLLSDLKGIKTCGIIAEDKKNGIVEIARPVGVVGAIVPSTNPLATPINNIINAIKCRNAIILSPSPKGLKVWEYLYKILQKELKRVNVPDNLIQAIPAPVNKEKSLSLMKQVDLIVCTGSQNNVRSVYSSGTPAIGVGVGNVPVIVDETADLHFSAKKIIESKTFDNSTSCSAENSLILVEKIYNSFLEELKNNGAVLLNNKDKLKLKKLMWQNGKLNPDIIAKDFREINQLLGFPANPKGKLFLVEEDKVGEKFPFSGEKLSLVLTIYKAESFLAATQKAEQILNYQGKGHSIGLHSTNLKRAKELGLELPVCRVIVNQPHCFATGGSFSNRLPFSLSMGCGSWGKNSISDNLNYKHFLNITRVVHPIYPPRAVTMQSIFGNYKKKYKL